MMSVGRFSNCDTLRGVRATQAQRIEPGGWRVRVYKVRHNPRGLPSKSKKLVGSGWNGKSVIVSMKCPRTRSRWERAFELLRRMERKNGQELVFELLRRAYQVRVMHHHLPHLTIPYSFTM